MKRSTLLRGASVFAATAVLLAGCGRDDESSSDDTSDDSSTDTGQFINPETDCTDYQATAGIEGDTIKIGTVRPASGNFAPYATITSGLEAYFKTVNDAGGVKAGDEKTYKLELLKEDDGYESSRTPGAVKKLVDQEGIFAMVGQLGTANNLSVRDLMNDGCIPSIGLATGSTEWGKAADYPWFISGLPSYATEAHNFVEFLKEENPSAKIALLYQDDDFGQAYKKTLASSIEGTDITIVDEASFNPLNETSTESKVAQLAQSEADVFFVGIGGGPCPGALGFIPTSWKPMTYISLTCASGLLMSLAGANQEGIYTAQATLDPASKTDQENEKIKNFLTAGKAAGLTDGELSGGVASVGWGFGALFVEILEKTPEVTRAGVMNTAFSMKDSNFGLLRDEIKANTDGADDPWLIEDLRIVKRTNGEWVEAVPNVSYDGKSNEFAK